MPQYCLGECSTCQTTKKMNRWNHVPAGWYQLMVREDREDGNNAITEHGLYCSLSCLDQAISLSGKE